MDILKKGKVIVEWVELGEGLWGDYDPENPEDIELLRFDAYIKNHEWEDGYPCYSYCTCLPVDITDDEKTAALKYIMEHLYPYMSKNKSCRDIAEKMSWINFEWLDKQPAL